jgi:hypothetical protein
MSILKFASSNLLCDHFVDVSHKKNGVHLSFATRYEGQAFYPDYANKIEFFLSVEEYQKLLTYLINNSPNTTQENKDATS